MSGCSRCPKWVNTQIKCSTCGQLYTVRHRETVGAVEAAERQNRHCPNCQNMTWEVIE